MWKKTKEMKWKTAKLLWGDLFYDIAGAVLFAAGVYTFAGNADFAPGGITGISLLLNHVFGIPVGTLTLFINLPLIVISYRTLGKTFSFEKAKSMVITTFFLMSFFRCFRCMKDRDDGCALFRSADGSRDGYVLYAGLFFGRS